MGRNAHLEWSRRVARWKDSGLTAKEFAAEIGVNPRTLQHWKWQITREGRSKPAMRLPEAEAHFVEVVTHKPRSHAPTCSGTETTPQAEPLELVFADGLRVRVPARFDLESLRRVVAAIGGR